MVAEERVMMQDDQGRGDHWVKQDDEIVIYTCITNKYDEVAPIDSSASGEKFICFTDHPELAPDGWSARPLQSPKRLCSGHDINRFHKIFPHRLFPRTRYSIYIDGNIRYLEPYHTLVSRVKAAGVALGAFIHPRKRGVREETEACAHLGKFDATELASRHRQLAHYEKAGFDLSAIITANYLLVRDHSNPILEIAMALWWSHLFEFTKRDQISLNYILWKTGLPWAYLDEDLGADATHLVRVSHRGDLWGRTKRQLKAKLRWLAQ